MGASGGCTSRRWDASTRCHPLGPHPATPPPPPHHLPTRFCLHAIRPGMSCVRCGHLCRPGPTPVRRDGSTATRSTSLNPPRVFPLSWWPGAIPHLLPDAAVPPRQTTLAAATHRGGVSSGIGCQHAHASCRRSSRPEVTAAHQIDDCSWTGSTVSVSLAAWGACTGGHCAARCREPLPWAYKDLEPEWFPGD